MRSCHDKVVCLNNKMRNESKHSLTSIASLTFVSGVLGQLAYIINGLIITPIVIRGLGAELYGAWQMIERTMQYLARSDLRPLGTLRVFLATSQISEDNHKKKRLIGAALLINLCLIPLIFIFGVLLIYNAPTFIHVSPELELGVQLAMIIAVLRVGFDRFLGLPGSVLAGVNMAYKAMWVTAFSIIVGGVISVIAVKSGWGLPGIASATILAAFLTGGIRYCVAKKNISWFGVAKPKKKEFRDFLNFSGWFFVSSYSDAFLNYSDLLLVGMILGPASAGIYATTGAVLRMIVGPMQQIVLSASSGIGYLCEIKAWERLAVVRQDIFVFSMVIMSVVGAGIIGLNSTFLHFWVGDEFYAGDVVNVLLVLIAIVRVTARVDYEIMDNLKMFKIKAVYQLICGIFTLCGGVLLTKKFGSEGMALTILCSQVVLLVLYRFSVRKVLTGSQCVVLSNVTISRVCLISLFSFLVSFIFCEYYTSIRFFDFVIASFFLAFLTFLVVWFIGINKVNRERLSNRFDSILFFRFIKKRC